MLRMLMKGLEINKDSFNRELESVGGTYKEEDFKSALRVLGKDFVNTQFEKTKYQNIEFFAKQDLEDNKGKQITRAVTFYSKLSEMNFKTELNNLIEYSLRKYEDQYMEHDEDNLVLYQKYSRKDVCRILNWEKDDSSTIYGYRIKYNTCPIFVTYEKKEDISSSTKYEDQFINNRIFSWMTRSKVSEKSTEAQELINSKQNGLKVYLFIKKSDGEGSDFYYMGKVNPIEWTETTIVNDKGHTLPIMNFNTRWTEDENYRSCCSNNTRWR